ncbi:YkyA family protein [Bacillus sp. CGMCC 1.16607]|uniref:YkyA family protein n=1 Tax=Bacillus sp. CGMCC 1.16607 TaxID=3351842 RepID=UPI00362F28DB
MLRRKGHMFIALITICILFSLGGCLNQKTALEKMYEVMEKVVKAENTFEDQQDPLVRVEQEEKELYDQIITLGMKEYDQIVKRADKALLLVDEREKLMKLETESIEKSKEQFKELYSLIKELDDEKMKKDANHLYTIMMDRYEIHHELEQSYTKALEYDKELYNLFKRKDLTLEQVENQINQINQTYEEIYKINDRFNNQTQKYNDLKLKFYKEAGFNIVNMEK